MIKNCAQFFSYVYSTNFKVIVLLRLHQVGNMEFIIYLKKIKYLDCVKVEIFNNMLYDALR